MINDRLSSMSPRVGAFEATPPEDKTTTAISSHAYIGLGSNLDNPIKHVQAAFKQLGQITDTQLLEQSPLYRSAPVGPAGQPDYINACALLQTTLTPLQLLDALQAIENSHQRVRKERWGARTLDLDLLLFGQQTIDTPRLQVPHPYLAERNFVLYPLADIGIKAHLPSGEPIAKLKQASNNTGLERLEKNS